MNHDFFGNYAKNIYRESEMQGEYVNCLRLFDMIAGCSRKNELVKNIVDLKLWSHKAVTRKLAPAMSPKAATVLFTGLKFQTRQQSCFGFFFVD